MKIVAIHGGGDWFDASADYLVLSPGMDVDKEQDAWRVWYRTEYCTAVSGSGKQPTYIPFVQWLINKGARRTTDDELEIFET